MPKVNKGGVHLTGGAAEQPNPRSRRDPGMPRPPLSPPFTPVVMVHLTQPCDTPGPAVYNVSLSHRDKRLRIKFRQGTRQSLHSGPADSPGPGYAKQKKVARKETKKTSQAKVHHFVFTVPPPPSNFLPPPSQLPLSPPLDNTSADSAYRPAFPAESSHPHVAFPKDTREHCVRSTSPGPGAYAATEFTSRGPQWSFATTPARTPDVAAPGAYASPSPTESSQVAPPRGTGVSFAKAARTPAATREGVPGPGAYDPIRALSFTRASRQGVTFAKSCRQNFSRGDLLTSAATGAHDPEAASASQRPRVKGCVFSSAPRRCSAAPVAGADSPGPAVYDAPRAVSSARRAAKAISFLSGRRHESAATDTPGPNAYHPWPAAAAQRSPGVSVGTAHREAGQPRAQGVPGPGAYFAAREDWAGAKAARTPRWTGGGSGSAAQRNPYGDAGVFARQETPGPGYDAPPVVGPATTIPKHGRDTKPEPSHTPGPTAYNPNIAFTRRNYRQSALLYLTG